MATLTEEDLQGIKLESLDTVPEALHGLFVHDEEAGHYRIGGVAPKQKLDEFRTNNVKYLKEKERLEQELARFKGIEDPEAARKAQAELDKLKREREAADAGTSDEEIEELLKKRYGQAMQDRDSQIEALSKVKEDLQGEIQKLQSELASRIIDTEVMIAAKNDGFVPQAVEDAISAARVLFKLEDGKAVPRKDGEIVYDKDGKGPLTIGDWLKSTKSSKPHWWSAGANGGGATSTDAGGDDTTMPRAAFEAIADPAKRAALMKKGVRLTD